MRTYTIPFNRPSFAGRELSNIAKAVQDQYTAGDGPFGKRCEALLSQILGGPAVLLTTSCTHALELAALLLDIAPGDEVVVPSFTFVSTANAFVLRGARPVFADIRPDTLNLDENALAATLSARTRAIVVVHYGGVACEMDAIATLASERGIAIVEDNAHGLFGRYRGRPLGTLGALATQSFHETKNLSCGEGGALVVNDRQFLERAEILREKGTDRSRFFRGQVDKYTWRDIGSSYVQSDVLAAYLFAQLERRDEIQRARARIWQAYDTGLAAWADAIGARRQVVPAHCEHPSHVYALVMPSPDAQAGLIDHLKRRDILAVIHYQPLHVSVMGARYGGRAGQCPVTEDVSSRLVRLPLYPDLTPELQGMVIDGVRSFTS